MDFKLLFLSASFVLLKCSLGLIGSSTTDYSTDYPNEDYCIYDEQDVQENPWTATLQIRRENIDVYFPVAILDAYSVLAYGTPFKWPGDKLGFLPWNNYTVLIEASGNGNKIPILQSLEVSFAQPHPDLVRRYKSGEWMYTENDYIVIHLKDPIILSSTVRPVCLPVQKFNDSSSNDDWLNLLYTENATVIVGGWKSKQELVKITLRVQLRASKECEEEWRLKTKIPLDQPYNRVCGYGTLQQSTSNPGGYCISKDSGVLVNLQGQGPGHQTFMGFQNNYYSDNGTGICNEKSILFLFKMNTRTIKWLNAAMSCGSSQYTCHNGECAPLSSLCEPLENGCSDGTDKDPKYCRSLNPCRMDQFECGVYGQCIPNITDGKVAQNCDGVVDCPEGEDEENCPPPDTPQGVPPIVWIAIFAGILVLIPALTLLWRRIRRSPPVMIQVIPVLTEIDLVDFHEGCVVEGASNLDTASNIPYNSLREEYEIDSEDITIGDQIGGGYFSDVYKAYIRRIVNSCSQIVECAVKIPKSSTDVEQIRGFLKEIKIMAYVGKHRNIANFIGAHTRRLREGILYIFVELCEFGSMEDFLRNYRNNFNNLLDDRQHNHNHQGNPGYLTYVDIPMFNTNDLIRWASEVAAGMAHLASKQVVHGDLAARNILLDSNRIAKICDFGLSHHLYTNIQYVTSPNSRVPWKWMAPEAMLERTLSTKSDVWSFGVTLWEIFSLGAEPYRDIPWSPAFPYSLSSTGCQLEQPQYATPEIFKIMQKCWAVEPNARPSFEEIESDLLGCLAIETDCDAELNERL